MERLILVEELDRRGRVRRITPVERLPFRIGRGYDCDLVLDDPHVSPIHAIVEQGLQDDGLVLSDAGSKNGISPEGERQAVSSVALSGGVSVRIGRTVLRLRAPDFPVAPALPIARRSTVSRWLLGHWSAALLLIALHLALAQLGVYQATTGKYDLTDGLSDGLANLLVIGGWVGCWALLNRLLRQQMRIIAHTSVACMLFIGALLADWCVEWLRFLVARIEPIQLLDVFLSATTLGLLLVGHLTVMRVARPLRRAGAALVAAAALLAYELIDHYTANENWVHTLPYWSQLKPVDPDWLPTGSAAEFFESVPDLEAELAELAREIEEERSDSEAESSGT